MDDAKIYNICLQRVKFQIGNARKRLDCKVPSGRRFILESYNSGDIDDIVDILEIYDITEQSRECLKEKLDDLAYTVSALVKDEVCFDYDERGDLCLYLVLREASPACYDEAEAELSAL